MNPMMAAIRKRKHGGDSMMGDHSASHMSSADMGDGHHQEGGKDLHGLVQSLNPHEKASLLTMLQQDNGHDAMAIAKGAPSKEEHGKIAQATAKVSAESAAEESAESPTQELGEDQSDEIGKSMLDSRHIRGMATEKPKNLGDRVKQSIASKLKTKGKI